MISEYCKQIQRHYSGVWPGPFVERRWTRGPVHELPNDFCVLEFSPRKARGAWTYATCCMSQPDDEEPLELHIFSPSQDDSLVEILYAVCHFHRTGCHLGLAHTVNFGKPWLEGSHCTFGLISLPYLDGPALEKLHTDQAESEIRFLWLIPITASEREFKKSHGLDALESRFEETKFNYLDPTRRSVVQKGIV